MKILYLGPNRQNITEYMESLNDEVVLDDSNSFLRQDLNDFDFIVSYGCRYLIPKRIIDKFYKSSINLHISYLPYNRGSDPNLWSFIEDTPKGVTIHYMNEGLDKGEIIVQEKLLYDEVDTLSSTYEKLSQTIERLFIENWKDIKEGRVRSYPQRGKGTYHKSADRKSIEHLLVDGWDTKVINLLGKH